MAQDQPMTREQFLSMPNRAIEAAARRTVEAMESNDLDDLASCSDLELIKFGEALQRCAKAKLLII